MAISVFAGLLFAGSSFTLGPVGDTPWTDNSPQKKEQRVKVIVNKNGKEIKIDTTFNGANEKTIQVKVDSILKKIEIDGIEPNMKNIIIYSDGKSVMWNNSKGGSLPDDKKFDVFFQNCDSGMSKHGKKVVRLIGDCSGYSFGTSEGDDLIPPPPPMPPHTPVMIHKQFGSDAFAFDTKDPSIISYEKKDIGKGLEKITIIRKKLTGQNKDEEVTVTVETSDDLKK